MSTGGGKGVGLNSNVGVTLGGATTLDVLGLNDVKIEADLKLPQPLQTESSLSLLVPEPVRTELTTRSELAITEPVNANLNGNVALDVKPLVFDLQLSLGKIVPARLRFPFHQHFGITLFGIELFGFKVSGETQILIHDGP